MVNQKVRFMSIDGPKNSHSAKESEELPCTQSSSLNPQHLFLDVSTELLERGHSVRFQAPGRSMHPTIKEGETITVEPVEPPGVRTGDIILYRTKTGVIAHRVIRIEQRVSSSEAALKAERPTLKHRFGQGDPRSPKGRSSSPQSSSLSPQHLFLLRGDASVDCDRPVEGGQILGKVVSVERNGRLIDPYSPNAKVMYLTHLSVSLLKRRIKRAFFRRRASLT